MLTKEHRKLPFYLFTRLKCLNQPLRFETHSAYTCTELDVNRKFISGHCSHFKPPEKNRKLMVFWCFRGYKVVTLDKNGLKYWILCQIYSDSIPTGNHRFNVNNRNTRTKY